jgi:fatty acid omega-hydroxylase
MRHFGPTHSPHVIPDMEPGCRRIVNDMLDKAKGKTRIDVVDDYTYPLPVEVVCRIMGVPLKDEPQLHAWIAVMMAGADVGPDAATEEGKRRLEKARASSIEYKKYFIRLVQWRKNLPKAWSRS